MTAQSTHKTVTSGVLYIHSAPRALCPHIEWAVASVLGVRVVLDWAHQPAEPAMWRAELSWRGETGTAARITSSLRGWQQLRFEATEDPADGFEGERYSSTPALGVYHAATGVHGDIMIPEDRLRTALQRAHRGESTLENEVLALRAVSWVGRRPGRLARV